MVYLDYSATTPVNPQVIRYFNECNLTYFANANSAHALGKKAANRLLKSQQNIHKLLNLEASQEIIFTSGATEANNLAIKGALACYHFQHKHIITTKLEHPSVIAPIGYLQRQGFEVDFVEVDQQGVVNLEHLKSLINPNTVLISISSVNSEIGIRQPLEAIKAIAKQYHCLFHCDVTQSIGKERINLQGIDLISLSAHKFYGLKGVGLLIKQHDIVLEPLNMGGHSTSNERAGTPPTPLLLSLEKALSLAYQNHERKYQHVQAIQQYLMLKLATLSNIHINSHAGCLPHITNISLLGIPSHQTVKILSQHGIYISSYTACASNNRLSMGVMSISGDKARARSSIRISLSYLTSKKEIDQLIKILHKEVLK